MDPTSILIASPWRHLPTVLYPWVRTIEKIVRAIQAPEISGPVVYIASDYSGAVKSHLYDVMSVLYLDLKQSSEWAKRRQLVRAQYMADGRRMSFKALNDRRRQEALVPFLDAANAIHGVALSIAIRKSISNLCAGEAFFKQCMNDIQLDHGWRLASFERMVRVVHLISVLIGGLSQPRQSIYWISDQDDMFANARRSIDVKKMLERYSSHYVSHPLGELGLGTTALDESDRLDEDLNAIPDLMSGAVAEVTTAVAHECGGNLPAPLMIKCPAHFSNKSELIYSWISDQAYRLRRAVIVIDKPRSGGLAVFKFDMGG
jgi:hypothetical protein